MNDWLLELTIGPVQGFIAAARRSRDLWAGSWILSELAHAMAASLRDGGARLIYPDEGRVRTRPGLRRKADAEDGASVELEGTSNLSNVILCRVEGRTEAEVRELANRGKRAAQTRLELLSDLALDDWQRAGAGRAANGRVLRRDLWRRQIATAIESYAVWSQLKGDDDVAYQLAHKALKRAMAQRKATRDFDVALTAAQVPLARGVPKSSLDGGAESVIDPQQWHPPRFGLGRGEQLDALGCIKRYVGLSERFTALTRLAADGWLQSVAGASQNSADRLTPIRTAYEWLVRRGLATRAIGPLDRQKRRIYERFPFDAGLLFDERLAAALEEARSSGDTEAATKLLELKAALADLYRAFGRPSPYVALIVADGDRMGGLVSRAKGEAGHAAISKAVAGFADGVADIAAEFRGEALYAGGEDLMLAVPLDGLVGLARRLSASFESAMQGIDPALLGGEEPLPTLRVGAAICHVLTPFGAIRAAVDAAEKAAKGLAGSSTQGHALAVHLHIRAGHCIPVRYRFDDGASFDAIATWTSAYRKDQFPGRLAYDLRDIAMRFGWRPGEDGTLQLDPVGRAIEFERVLRRSRASGGERDIPLRRELKQRLQALDAQLARGGGAGSVATRNGKAGPDEALLALAHELLLARWLAAHRQDQLGERA